MLLCPSAGSGCFAWNGFPVLSGVLKSGVHGNQSITHLNASTVKTSWISTHTMTLGRSHIPNRLYSYPRQKRSSAQPERRYCPHAHFSDAILLFSLVYSFLVRQKDLHITNRNCWNRLGVSMKALKQDGSINHTCIYNNNALIKMTVIIIIITEGRSAE